MEDEKFNAAKERFYLDKETVECESLRRGVEVYSHAIKLTEVRNDNDLRKKLTDALTSTIDKLENKHTQLEK